MPKLYSLVPISLPNFLFQQTMSPHNEARRPPQLFLCPTCLIMPCYTSSMPRAASTKPIFYHRDALAALHRHKSLASQLAALQLMRRYSFIARIVVAVYDSKRDLLKTYVDSGTSDHPLRGNSAKLGAVVSLHNTMTRGAPRVVNDLDFVKFSCREYATRIRAKIVDRWFMDPRGIVRRRWLTGSLLWTIVLSGCATSPPSEPPCISAAPIGESSSENNDVVQALRQQLREQDLHIEKLRSRLDALKLIEEDRQKRQTIRQRRSPIIPPK